MSTSVVFTWLDRIGLSYAIDAFRERGVTTPHQLVNLTHDKYPPLRSEGE